MSDLYKKDFLVTVQITVEAFDKTDASQYVQDIIDELAATEMGDQYQAFIEANIDSIERMED